MDGGRRKGGPGCKLLPWRVSVHLSRLRIEMTSRPMSCDAVDNSDVDMCGSEIVDQV